MSSHTLTGNCPRCGGEETLEIEYETRPVDQYHIVCTRCGMCADTVFSGMTLADLNEHLHYLDNNPVEALAPPLEKWVRDWKEIEQAIVKNKEETDRKTP